MNGMVMNNNTLTGLSHHAWHDTIKPNTYHQHFITNKCSNACQLEGSRFLSGSQLFLFSLSRMRRSLSRATTWGDPAMCRSCLRTTDDWHSPDPEPAGKQHGYWGAHQMQDSPRGLCRLRTATQSCWQHQLTPNTWCRTEHAYSKWTA